MKYIMTRCTSDVLDHITVFSISFVDDRETVRKLHLLWVSVRSDISIPPPCSLLKIAEKISKTHNPLLSGLTHHWDGDVGI
jgi:hypothetical protein